MQSRSGRIRRLAGWVLCIGFGVQICMGLVWLLCNLGGFPKPGESLFGVDGNRVTACVQRLVQLAVAAGAADLFLRTIRVKKRSYRLFAVLVILTFPMALQSHLSLRGDSLLSSLELVQITVLIRLVFAVKERNKAIVVRFSAFFVSITVLLGALGLYAERGEPHTKGVNRIYASAISRYAWTDLRGAYNAWPGWMQEAVPYSIMIQTKYYADNVEYVLMPYLEQTIGEDREIRQLAKQIVQFAIQRDTQGIVREILWDAAGYTISPVVFQLQLAGGGYDSYSGVNYDDMLQRTPLLSKYYMTYGCRWFGFVWFVTACFAICRRMKKKDAPGKQQNSADYNEKRIVIGTCGSAMAVLILHYTFRGAGMMDYRKTLVIVLLWGMWMLHEIAKTCFDGQDKEGI